MFIQKARTILSDNAGIRRLPHCRNGPYLDEPRLGLVPAGESRIFARPLRRQYHSYHVGLLVDCSGSMSGKKIETAATAIHALAWALQQAGAAVTVWGFNCVLREWKEKEIENLKEFSKACDQFMEETGYGNHDSYHLRTVGQLLAARSEPGQLLIVLSDGHPTCDKGTDCAYPGNKWKSRSPEAKKALSTAVRQLSRRLTLLAVGIRTEAPREFYGEHRTIVLQDLAGLYGLLMAWLERHFIRG